MCSPRKSDENFLILTFLWIKTNVAYTRLEVIAKQRSALQVEFITGVKLICYFVLHYCFLQWDHLPNMAVGDLALLYSISMCIILILAWGSNWGSSGFSRNQDNRGTSGAYVTCIYCGLSVKINTHIECRMAQRSWAHLFCVCFCACDRQKPEDPKFEPHGWRRHNTGRYRRSGIFHIYLCRQCRK